MTKHTQTFVASLMLAFAFGAQAASDWNSQDYDVYPGDFNGDGKQDLLYIAISDDRENGIALSDGAQPVGGHQIWSATGFGIPWSAHTYIPVIGDFNWDGRSDIFMHRQTPGYHHLLLANADGTFSGVAQTIANNHGGSLIWSGDQHRVLSIGASNPADTQHPRGDRLVLQAARRGGTNAIFATGYSQLISASTLKYWGDGYLSFQWNANQATLYSGDFDADGEGDLLLQAKPDVILVDYDIPIPVPRYRPGSFGIVYSPITSTSYAYWDRMQAGVDWSAARSNLTILDVDADGTSRSDVIVQPRGSSGTTYLVRTNPQTNQLYLGSPVALSFQSAGAGTGAAYRIIAGNFDGGIAQGVYLQATSSSGSNLIASTIPASGGSVSTTAHSQQSQSAAPTGVGILSGAARVNATGAATYQIPIALPPGTNNLTPALSLNYDHHSGNGLLGVGWSLGGFSTISRCNKTIAQDGAVGAPRLEINDGYCLDGTRLRLEAGTYGQASSTYRTEIEVFSRVVATSAAASGPTEWELHAKDGRIYEYGKTTDSRIETVGSGVARLWALNRIRDPNGNYIEFVYVRDTANGSYRPSEIRYTGHSSVAAATKVVFEYEAVNRPDPIYGYRYGNYLTTIEGPINEFKRLDRINVVHIGSGTTIRTYDLSYEAGGGAGQRSRLSSVQECAAGECLAATSLQWINGTSSWAGSEANSGQSISANKLIGDINGDGRDDVVFSSTATSGTGTWYYSLGGASGLSSVVDSTRANWNQADAQLAEWNGDGMLDLLVPCNDSGMWCVLQANGAGFAAAVSTGTPSTGSSGSVLAADVDGDGRDDLVRMVGTDQLGVRLREAGGFGSEVIAWTSEDSQQDFFGDDFSTMRNLRLRGSHQRIDLNGDGREDFMLQMKYDEIDPEANDRFYFVTFYGGGSTITSGSRLISPSMPMAAGDFNGDGLTDLVIKGTSAYSIRMGQGMSVSASLPGPSTSLTHAVVATDYDGDGLDDLLIAKTVSSTTTWQVARSTGNGLALLSDLGLPASTGINNGLAMDINGDGLGDVVRLDGGILKYRLHNGVYPDLLDRVTDGFGMYVDFNYQPLTAGQPTYTKGSGAPAGVIEWQGPLYVVSGYTATDGIGGTYAMTLAYQQARHHLLGRGFLGFSKRTVTDSRNSIRVEETYAQDPDEYQAIGALTLMQVKQSSGTLISETTNSWSKVSYGSGVIARRAPYMSQQVTKRYEVEGAYNGVLVATATTTNSIDSVSGVIYDSTRTIVEAPGANGVQQGQSYSQRIYHPLADLVNDTSTSSWCLGLPGRTQFTNSHTQFGGGSVTRTVNRSWDTTKCRLTQEVAEQGDSELQVTTDLTYDDASGEVDPDVGNITKIIVTGVGMLPRITRRSWGADGRLLRTVTNALSQSVTYDWDSTRGLPTSETDPNGITVAWQYDNFGRRIREDRPDGTFTKWTLNRCSAQSCLGDSLLRWSGRAASYSAAGSLTQVSDQYFDAANRLRFQDAPAFSAGAQRSRVAQQYDAFGRLSQQSLPYFGGGATYWQTLTYDLANRLKKAQRPVSALDSTQQETSIYYEGLTTRVVDALSHEQKTISNILGMTARSIDHNNYYQSFDYDSFGNVVRVMDSAGNALQSITYNVSGVKKAQTDMDLGAWTYKPNALGEVEYIRDAKTSAPNWTTVISYDKLGRMATRQDVAEGVTSTWTWGNSSDAKNIGRLASVAASAGGYSEEYFYDSLGRPQTTRIISDATYFIDYSYNSLGTLDTLTYPASTSSYRLKLQYEYSNGFLQAVKDHAAPATIFWRANAADALGNVVDETLGNGLRTSRGFDAVTSQLSNVQTVNAGGASVQNLAYLWDRVGNLQQRRDVSQNLTEEFIYDSMDRLDFSKLNGVTNLDLSYDSMGNVLSKSDVGSYAYHATKKHAVTAAGALSYAYDANGNVSSRNGATLTWYSYNLPNTINGSAGNSSQFFYAPDRSRWKQVASYGGTSEETIYIGGLIEKVTLGGVTSWKHYISGGTGPVATYVRKNSGTNEIHYLTRDHLGSIDSVTNDAGAIEVRLSFGSFGQRRNEAGWSGNPTSGDWTQITNTTRAGFTSHEMLDNLNLVHMNGRVYDQVVGRFLSADPFVQAPGFTQSFNRYSYTFNSPLTHTDPSGFQAGPEEYCQDSCTPGFGVYYNGAYVGYVGSWGGLDALLPAANVHNNVYIGSSVAQQLAWDDFAERRAAARIAGGRVAGPENGNGNGGGPTPGNSTAGGLFFEPMYEPLHLTDAPDPATVAGLVAGVGNTVGDGLAFNNRMWGYWKGRNGKWNKDTWGGNGATGGRSVAFSRAAAWKFLGTAGAVSGIVISSSTIVGALANGRPNDVPKPVLDIGVTGWSVVTGPPGWVVGTSYFLIDATIGWGPALESMNHNMEQNRAVLGPTWVPWARE